MGSYCHGPARFAFPGRNVSHGPFQKAWQAMLSSLILSLIHLQHGGSSHVLLAYMHLGTLVAPSSSSGAYLALFVGMRPLELGASLGMATSHSISLNPSWLHAPLGHNRLPYLEFLRNSNGRDLWPACDNRSALTHYTFSRGNPCSILDCVAHSHSGVVTGSFDLAPVFIGATDHGPIYATVMLSQSGFSDAQFNQQPASSIPQRFRYRFRYSRQTLTDFAAPVDSTTADFHLDGFQIHDRDDASFASLYNSLTRILLPTAASTFQLPSKLNNSPRLRNPTIRLLVREGRRIGSLIFAVMTVPLAVDRFCKRYPWAPPYLSAFLALTRKPKAFAKTP